MILGLPWWLWVWALVEVAGLACLALGILRAPVVTDEPWWWEADR